MFLAEKDRQEFTCQPCSASWACNGLTQAAALAVRLADDRGE
jgi:hypothetical protein